MYWKRRKMSNEHQNAARVDAARILPRELWTMIFRAYLDDNDDTNAWPLAGEAAVPHQRRGYKFRRDALRCVCKLFATILENGVYTHEYFSRMGETGRAWTALDLGDTDMEAWDKWQFYRLLMQPSIAGSVTALYNAHPNVLIDTQYIIPWHERLTRVTLCVELHGYGDYEDAYDPLIDAMYLLKSARLRELTIVFTCDLNQIVVLDEPLANAIMRMESLGKLSLQARRDVGDPLYCIEALPMAHGDSDRNSDWQAADGFSTSFKFYNNDADADGVGKSSAALMRKWKIERKMGPATRRTPAIRTHNNLNGGYDARGWQTPGSGGFSYAECWTAPIAYHVAWDTSERCLDECMPTDIEQLELVFYSYCQLVERTNLRRYTKLRRVRVWFMYKQHHKTTRPYDRCAFLLPPSVERVEYVAHHVNVLPQIEYIDQTPLVAAHILYLPQPTDDEYEVSDVCDRVRHFRKTPFSWDHNAPTRALFFTAVEPY